MIYDLTLEILKSSILLYLLYVSITIAI